MAPRDAEPAEQAGERPAARDPSAGAATAAAALVPRGVAPYASWEAAGAAPAAAELALGARGAGASVAESVRGLRGCGAAGALRLQWAERLCGALQGGGAPAAEAARHLGAIEALCPLLGAAATVAPASEALWLLVDDYDSCQPLVRCGGHAALLRAVREHGPRDARLAASVFRLLSETLYNEARGSEVWASADGVLLTEALGWALHQDSDGSAGGALGCVCDVAALWVQRVTVRRPEAAQALVGVVPLLLARMAARTDDAALLQHGCRLLYALGRSCQSWPEDARAPALAALAQLAQARLLAQNPALAQYVGLAFHALQASPQPAEAAARAPAATVALSELD